MSTINIIFDRTSTIDPVTRGLDIALRYLHIDVDVPFWSQYISFRLLSLLLLFMSLSYLFGFFDL